MLSNKLLILIAALGTLLILSCGEDTRAPLIDFQNQDYVLKRAKESLGQNVKFANSGYFTADSALSVAAGVEVANKDSWGIKFYLLAIDGYRTEEKLTNPTCTTDLSMKPLIKKIKFPDFDYELIYYNSQDYFMGSGGGEVFSYIADFNLKRIYYAHLITESDAKISLFISENTELPIIKNFFIGNFKRDYPSFTLLSEDKKLDF